MPEPYCLAMVLCDHVHRDVATGKFTILGTFNTLAAKEFPAKLQFCVYYSVTDGLGPTTIQLRLVDASSGIVDDDDDPAAGVVCEFSAEVNFENPLVVMEVSVGIAVDIAKEGLYHCELWAGRELLMSRRLLAAQGPSQQAEGEGGDHE